MIDSNEISPFAAGFRMPAEWEPHEATWIAWPHNDDDWPGKLAAVRWAYGEIVRHLAAGEVVRILVNDAAHQQHATELLRRVGVDLSRVEFDPVPTNRGWSRDFGPLFVRNDATGEIAIARFRFNGWAKYDDWQLDDAVPDHLAGLLGVPSFPVTCGDRDVVLEGGAIDVNGTGTLLTTEECLLDPAVQVRNPGMGREEIEETLKQSVGATNVIWLGQGYCR